MARNRENGKAINKAGAGLHRLAQIGRQNCCKAGIRNQTVNRQILGTSMNFRTNSPAEKSGIELHCRSAYPQAASGSPLGLYSRLRAKLIAYGEASSGRLRSPLLSSNMTRLTKRTNRGVLAALTFDCPLESGTWRFD